MKFYSEPDCEKCGRRLEATDCYDTEFSIDNVVYHMEGRCPNCEAVYTWDEIFEYEKSANLEMVEGGII